jgi:type I restriction enzyme S subunit
MSKVYPLVPLSEVLKRQKNQINIQEIDTYTRITIRMNGQGIVMRDRIPGSKIGTKKQFITKAGQLVLSKIDARNGAFGILPDECDGAIITGNFWAFDVKYELLDIRYFDYLTKTPLFIDFCIRTSDGTTNRRYLQSAKFLAMEIPLPPLEEQRRIVARVEVLAGKIEEARCGSRRKASLRRQAIEETEVLGKSALTLTFEKQIKKQGWELKPLRQAAEIARGKFAHRPRNEPRFYGGDIPFIQIGDISNSNRYIRQYSQTLNKDGLNISRMFPKGTVVIAITGATIGVTGLLTFDCCFPDSIVGIIAQQTIAIPEFIYWAVEYVKRLALAEATQTTQPNIATAKAVIA